MGCDDPSPYSCELRPKEWYECQYEDRSRRVRRRRGDRGPHHHSIWPRHLVRTQILLAKFEQMDAADASLVVLSEQFPKAQLVTIDARHFKVYRRLENERMPLITP